MAKRPWVRPPDVKGYSSFKEIAGRSDIKLQTDISRAEAYILSYTNNNDLTDDVKFPVIPDEVKTAVILVAEGYAYNAELATKNVKSETFDDYSYTLDTKGVDIALIDLSALLDNYIVAKAKNRVTMKLRSL